MDLRDPRGDAVADVLGVSFMRHALYKPLEAHAPWGVRIPHRPRASFYIVTRGSARIEVEGENVHVLSPGEVVFIPHGTAHALRDAADSKLQDVCDGALCPSLAPRRIGGRGSATSIVAGFFEVGSGHEPPLLQKMPALVVLSASEPTFGRWIEATLQLVLAESAAPGPASSMVLQCLADVLFVLALRSAEASGRRKASGIPALSEPRIYEALNLMHVHVAEPWTVMTLARRVNMSRSGFAARFTELVGEPPLQYLARWRVTRAAEMLRDTNEKVAAVANLVGYESLPAFSRAFKRWQGESPATFRRKLAH
ncbi:AraC family transcriptional regulator [Pendulispora albinea]|uniref:AraC family transcriptional regulator n=1 Tax=Pendulispora albinea TaxID=2741071 RepID=A0ABZ2LLM5_9BACT